MLFPVNTVIEGDIFNPFSTNISLLYLLTTLENRRFSDVFRRYRSGILVENGLTIIIRGALRILQNVCDDFVFAKKVSRSILSPKVPL